MADHTALVRWRCLGRSARSGSRDDTGSRRCKRRTSPGSGRARVRPATRRVHAAEAGLLVAGRGRPAGLVVHDDQLAVGPAVKPVDDAAAGAGRRYRPRAPSRCDGGDLVGVLQLEVVPDEDGGFVGHGPAARVVKAESHELGVIADRRHCLVEATEPRPPGPLPAAEMGEEPLEGGMDTVPFTAEPMVLREAGR